MQPEHGTITVQDKSNNNAVNSGDLVMTGDELTVKVAPDEGYQIKHWLINDKEKVLTSYEKNVTSEMVVGATKISALIEPIPGPSKLTLAVEPDYGGSLEAHELHSGGKLIPDLDKVKAGTKVCLVLKPKEGYSIKHWFVDGEETPPNPSEYSRNKYNFTMDKDKTITAVLNVPAPPAGSHRITLVAEGKGALVATDGSNKAVKSGDIVKEGTFLTFTATPAEGYEVDTCYVNGTEDFGSSGQTTIEKDIYDNTSVKVVFKQIQMYTVTYSAGENGSIVAKLGDKTLTSPAKVANGANVTLIATPNEGYEIEGWYKDGATVADPTLSTKTEIEEWL